MKPLSPAGSRKVRTTLMALAGLALPATAPAQASPAQERTGPAAQPPTLPDYGRPRELPAATEAPPAPATGNVPGGIITDIRVAADPIAGGEAVPPDQWRPPEDPVSGLRLDHARGEPLGEAWVRRQFAGNAAAGLSAADAVTLVQLINRAYLTAGFVNSGLLVTDRSNLAAGVLDLRLVFGGLVSASADTPPLTIAWGEDGRRGLNEAYVRDRFPSASARPLSALEIERDFRLLAEDPAIRTVNADLRPGARPGEASLHLIVHPERQFDVYLGVANDRSPSVGGERIFAGGHVRSMIVPGDLFSAEGGLTEGIEDVQASYSVPFFTPRTFLSLRGSLNNAAVIDAALVPLDIQAEDRSGQIGISHRFIEEPLSPSATPGRWSSSRTLTAGVLLSHRQQKSFLLGQPFSFAPGSVDGRSEYTALRFTADYLVRNVDQVFAVALTATIGAGGTQSPLPGVQNPDENFKVLLAQINYARRLNANGLELRARLTGQIADSILYSGERLSIGGESSVRGYRENLFLVDNGLIGSIELAQPFSLTPRAAGERRFDWGAFTASVFADAAVYGNAEPPHPTDRFIAGAGLSLAWTPSDAIAARVSYGIAFDDIVLPGGKDIQDHGLHFRLTVYPLRLFSRGRR